MHFIGLHGQLGGERLAVQPEQAHLDLVQRAPLADAGLEPQAVLGGDHPGLEGGPAQHLGAVGPQHLQERGVDLAEAAGGEVGDREGHRALLEDGGQARLRDPQGLLGGGPQLLVQQVVLALDALPGGLLLGLVLAPPGLDEGSGHGQEHRGDGPVDPGLAGQGGGDLGPVHLRVERPGQGAQPAGGGEGGHPPVVRAGGEPFPGQEGLDAHLRVAQVRSGHRRPAQARPAQEDHAGADPADQHGFPAGAEGRLVVQDGHQHAPEVQVEDQGPGGFPGLAGADRDQAAHLGHGLRVLAGQAPDQPRRLPAGHGPGHAPLLFGDRVQVGGHQGPGIPVQEADGEQAVAVLDGLEALLQGRIPAPRLGQRPEPGHQERISGGHLRRHYDFLKHDVQVIPLGRGEVGQLLLRLLFQGLPLVGIEAQADEGGGQQRAHQEPHQRQESLVAGGLGRGIPEGSHEPHNGPGREDRIPFFYRPHGDSHETCI